MFRLLFFIPVLFFSLSLFAQSKNKAVELALRIGVMQQGKLNAITDVAGVSVGHTTIIKADSIRTGITAILPHSDNLFQQKVPAAIYVGNGYGKLAGYTQVKELGNIESPIILTNTLSVATGINALIKYTLSQRNNESIQSVNAIVGETNDGYLNDIRGQHITEADVLNAIKNADSGAVTEGNVGAGTGTVCFGFKGGIGTSSRVLPKKFGGYTVGVLVQTNFGGVLSIDGVPVGEELKKYYLYDQLNDSPDGSCMIVVATDAPLDSRNLERMAKRAFMGLAKTGGIASNGSGDYIIAFSTDTAVRVKYNVTEKTPQFVLSNEAMSPLFMATIEATEEAIINSLLAAETMKGKNGRIVEAIPFEEIKKIFRKYNRIN